MYAGALTFNYTNIDLELKEHFQFGFLQLFRVLTRKNPNFYNLRVPDPKKPEP